MKTKFMFEVCANSVESCIAAQDGGADRVELCAAIPEGGTTPSFGEISLARKVLNRTRLHVILRPRGGDFCYSQNELEAMLLDLRILKQIGVDGVVFGFLRPSGELHLPFMTYFMKEAQGLSVTFHRAFDVCAEPSLVMEQLISLGVDRILTSGGRRTAEEGVPLLRDLQAQANGRISLMAGCGVNEQNIAPIARLTGITEFHFSARESISSSMEYFNPTVSMGSFSGVDEYERMVTTSRRVAATIAALNSDPML